jgi:hypothetical protein
VKKQIIGTILVQLALWSFQAKSATFKNYYFAFEQSTITDPSIPANERLNYDVKLQVRRTTDSGSESWTPVLFWDDLGKENGYLKYIPVSDLGGGKLLEEAAIWLEGNIFCPSYTDEKNVTPKDPTICHRAGPTPYEADRQRTLWIRGIPNDVAWTVRN